MQSHFYDQNKRMGRDSFLPQIAVIDALFQDLPCLPYAISMTVSEAILKPWD